MDVTGLVSETFLDVLPPLMHDPVLFAVPFFLLLLDHRVDGGPQARSTSRPRRAPVRGLPAAATPGPASRWGWCRSPPRGAWKALALLGYAALYAYVAPWHLPSTAWYTWVIAIVGVDLLFYAYHRMAHRVRLFWATHQAHHSSQYFNFATALRQKWNNSGEILIWIPLPLLRRSAVDGVRQLLDQPGLPVLGAHRTHRQALAANRIRLQHAVASPRAPRHGPAVPRQELRRHPHRVGPAVRQLRRRDRSDRTTG